MDGPTIPSRYRLGWGVVLGGDFLKYGYPQSSSILGELVGGDWNMFFLLVKITTFDR